MPPVTSADNGGFAFLITLRPSAGNYTRERANDLINWLEQSSKGIICDWLFAVEEEDNHAHICAFLHEPYQRRNLIKQLLNHPLRWMSEAEAEVFTNYDRRTNQAAVKAITTVEVVTSYLSGGVHFARKQDRPYEVLIEKLPEGGDVAPLEEYLPAVNGLKRKRQISVWYAEQERLLQAEGVSTRDITIREIQTFLARRMFTDRDMEIISDPRRLRERVNALYSYCIQPTHLMYITGMRPEFYEH